MKKKIIIGIVLVALIVAAAVVVFLNKNNGVSETIIQYATNAYQEVVKLNYHKKSDKIKDICFRQYKSLDEIHVPPYPYSALIPKEGYIFYFAGSPDIENDSAMAFVSLDGKVTVAYDDRSYWGAFRNILSKVVGRATDEQIKQASDLAKDANPLHEYLWPKLSTIFKFSRNDTKATGISAYFTEEEIARVLVQIQWP